MRVLLVGGTRFIGRALVEVLHRQGHEVQVFHRGETPARLPVGVAERLGDRSEVAALRAALRWARPHCVVDTVLHNREQAQDLVRASATATARLVVLSSMDVYRAWDRFLRLETGPTEPLPLSEDAPLRRTEFPRRAQASGPDDPRFRYDKLHVEQALRSAAGLAVTILRLPFVFGPKDYRHRVRQYSEAMDVGRPIRLAREQAQWRCTRAFVENAANAIALAACDENAAGATYNVGEEPPLTEVEWVRAIGRAVDWPGQVETCDTAAEPGNTEPVDWRQHLVLDTSRLRTICGFRAPVHLDDALHRTIPWARKPPT